MGQVTEGELERSAPPRSAGRRDPLPVMLWAAAVAGLALAVSAPLLIAAVVGVVVAGAALTVALTRRRTELGILVAAAVGALLVLPVAAVAQWQPEISSGAPVVGPATPGPSASQAPAPTLVPLPPDAVAASGYAEDSLDASGEVVTFVPADAVDGDVGTAWRVPGDGVGDHLVLSWYEPVVVNKITVVPGYAKVDEVDGTDRFYQNRRVVQAALIFDDDYAQTVTFADTRDPQWVDVPAVTTSELTVRILSTTEPGERDFAAISEILVEGSP